MRVHRAVAIGSAVALNVIAAGILAAFPMSATAGGATVHPGDMGYNTVTPNDMGYNTVKPNDMGYNGVSPDDMGYN